MFRQREQRLEYLSLSAVYSSLQYHRLRCTSLRNDLRSLMFHLSVVILCRLPVVILCRLYVSILCRLPLFSFSVGCLCDPSMWAASVVILCRLPLLSFSVGCLCCHSLQAACFHSGSVGCLCFHSLQAACFYSGSVGCLCFHSLQVICFHSLQATEHACKRSESARERRIALYKSDQRQNPVVFFRIYFFGRLPFYFHCLQTISLFIFCVGYRFVFILCRLFLCFYSLLATRFCFHSLQTISLFSFCVDYLSVFILCTDYLSVFILCRLTVFLSL